MTPTRRLAAIMAADVAGFSAAMERDEEGTFAQVHELRRKIIEPKIDEHNGRLVKTTGDGFLAEFASPISAMRCALAIQAEAATAPLQLRIGLNLGDVIVEADGDVYGEGVNVAARLEALADAGGILISAKVHSEVEGKVETAFEDRGEQQVKNIARPVRVYAARIATAKSVGVAPAAVGDGKPLPLPDKPSIAVLPFQNMSGDPEQEYFADGMVEEIITALSRFHWLFVIARTSTFAYKGKQVDIKQVGRELGVRYVLEGSVRKAAGRVRITGQLIDATTGAHLWADRFEGALDNVFELQDQVAGSVVGAIDPKLLEAEIARVKRKPVSNLDAYDCFLRASGSKWEDHETGHRLLYRAIELDPNYAQAYALAPWGYVFRLSFGLTAEERHEAERLAREAVRLGKDDAFCLCWAGFSLALFAKDLAEATELMDRALALNPNLARAWNLSGWLRNWLEQPEIAIEHLARAMRLSPLDYAFHAMENATANAHFRAGRYGEALRWAERAVRRQPNALGASAMLATIRATVGDLEGARNAMSRALQTYPAMRIAALLNDPTFFSPNAPSRNAMFVDLWRKAGLPE